MIAPFGPDPAIVLKLGKIYSEYRRLGGEISADTTDLEILRGRIENFEEAIRLAQLQQKILKDKTKDYINDRLAQHEEYLLSLEDE